MIVLFERSVFLASLKKECLNIDLGNYVLLQNIEAKKSILNYIGLRALELNDKSLYKESLDGQEACVTVLCGKANVKVGENEYKNIGRREKNFDKNPTDSVYITNKDSFEISSDSNARVVISYAISDKVLESKLIKAEDNSVEKRGKGMNKRLVNNILPDSSTISDKLIVVEVYTDEANWSSYPPHKHDTASETETFLEEIYYHEMDKEQGFVFQRVYTDDRVLDETMSLYNKDAVMVPRGYHPVAVPYGYNSYYLNVMAGPNKEWKFHNEKDHEWIIDRKDVE
ncbi:5-deoxy-glucuronate isomerase [Anaerococcus tetradius ATCC 35098]|uniref:5-deoxy-glucuronate isomerase n=1 Tax=Anaerococcus tetradius ATCC 35098 TaxID=525255 RepID=C2CHT6_9FIRM|nr:5-deoxy-glucuronate isomerase [Anaerococcus tetradius ATCC 35098]